MKSLIFVVTYNAQSTSVTGKLDVSDVNRGEAIQQVVVLSGWKGQ